MGIIILLTVTAIFVALIYLFSSPDQNERRTANKKKPTREELDEYIVQKASESGITDASADELRSLFMVSDEQMTIIGDYGVVLETLVQEG